MATAEFLLDAEVLFAVGSVRRPTARRPRRFHATERCLDWIKDINTNNPASPEGYEEVPKIQLYNLLRAYSQNSPLKFEKDFHPMRPGYKNIWELKTLEIRIFGFFTYIDEFVAVVADYKWRILQYGLYSGYRDEVESFRYYNAVPYVKENGAHHVLS